MATPVDWPVALTTVQHYRADCDCSDKNVVLTTRVFSAIRIRPSVYKKIRMWANAQRDGRPVEYRWRPLFNDAKFGPLLECRAVTLPRRETG